MVRVVARVVVPGASSKVRAVRAWGTGAGRLVLVGGPPSLHAPNHLLAKLFHHQLAALLRKRFGDPLWPNRWVGPYLARERLAPGSGFDGLPRLEELSGEPFGAAAFKAVMKRPPEGRGIPFREG